MAWNRTSLLARAKVAIRQHKFKYFGDFRRALLHFYAKLSHITFYFNFSQIRNDSPEKILELL
jgi:hypothetical protein